MVDKAGIRHAVLVEGKSQRQVAEETGHSRNTIRKMIEDSSRPKYRMNIPRESPVLGPYKALLQKWVEEDAKKVKKQRRTTVRMYQILQEEEGYAGAESTLRAYVGVLRRKAKKKVYVPLAYEPGETGQVDFGEAEVRVAGKEEKAHLFLMWLGYSGATLVQAYPAETQEVFFTGHVAALEFFGGVPKEIWYDNLTNAVQKVLKGKQRTEQESFISFRTHYLFQAEFCNVASGWEKGGVEGRVGYVRRNWLIGAPEFESWEALNNYLREQCRREQQRQLRGRSQTIGAGLQEERAAMRPLPDHPYPCCKIVSVKANHLSLVTFATNRYSVPVEWSHEILTLRAYVDRIEISCGAEVIAHHLRCWGREQDVLDPQHYLSLLAQRPRAFAHARAIREWREKWPAVFDHYFERLKERHATAEATRIFIDILKLGRTFPETLLADALQEALERDCLVLAGVRELLRRRSETEPPSPALLVDYPHLARIRVTPPDLQCFNQLLPQMAGGGS
jgi:transposase